MPVRVTFASASTAIVPRAEVPAWPVGKTFASASAMTVGVPTEETIDGSVATAYPFTPTPLTAPVALCPVTATFASASVVTVPKADVAARPVTFTRVTAGSPQGPDPHSERPHPTAMVGSY